MLNIHCVSARWSSVLLASVHDVEYLKMPCLIGTEAEEANDSETCTNSTSPSERSIQNSNYIDRRRPNAFDMNRMIREQNMRDVALRY